MVECEFIELQFGLPDKYTTELIPNHNVLQFSTVGDILTNPLINFLKTSGYPVENAVIFYWSPML
jgi:hypothetical protein